MSYLKTLSLQIKRRAVILILMLIPLQSTAEICSNNTAFNFDSGNAYFEVLLPAFPIDVVKNELSATGGDATLILRFLMILNNSVYDASAPYHPTAVGIYSHLGRRPANESATNSNINIALLYAAYRSMSHLLPNLESSIRDTVLCNYGLDPDNNSMDITTAVGIGNTAAQAIIEGRVNDGMNQLGNENGIVFNQEPYRDYTNYSPVNTAYKLKRPGRWQPNMTRVQLGTYKIQQYVTPQYANVEPYSFENPRHFRFPFPRKSDPKNRRAYRQQADHVLEVSANLTDEQKIKAEFFDDKLTSGFTHFNIAAQLPLLETLQYELLVTMAAFDAGIVVWQEKTRFDTVRPFSAIRYLYGDQEVTAWGGPSVGTVNNIPANQWQSYLPPADHPEYPSASTCFCNAQAQAMRRFSDSDQLLYPFSLPYPPGSSRIEPGITPAQTTPVAFNTWTEFATDCGQSRIWAGVHFQDAVDASAEICPAFGDIAYDYMQTLIDGTADEREPSERLADDYWGKNRH